MNDRLGRAALVVSAVFVAAFFLLMRATPSYPFLGSHLPDAIFALGYTLHPAHASVWLHESPR